MKEKKITKVLTEALDILQKRLEEIKKGKALQQDFLRSRELEKRWGWYWPKTKK
jgi:hypothetical protein